jgi:predicted HicB family RNase H-like nuclease
VKGVLVHRGYIGSVSFSADDDVLHGKLEGIRDLVTYEGTDVASLKRNFQEAVDDYLNTCGKMKKQPQVPFRGSFNVRVGRELHKRAAVFAAEHNMKLNSVVSEALEQYLTTANC